MSSTTNNIEVFQVSFLLSSQDIAHQYKQIDGATSILIHTRTKSALPLEVYRSMSFCISGSAHKGQNLVNLANKISNYMKLNSGKRHDLNLSIYAAVPHKKKVFEGIMYVSINKIAYSSFLLKFFKDLLIKTPKRRVLETIARDYANCQYRDRVLGNLTLVSQKLKFFPKNVVIPVFVSMCHTEEKLNRGRAFLKVC